MSLAKTKKSSTKKPVAKPAATKPAATKPAATKPAPGATRTKPRGSKFRTIREAAQFGGTADVKAFLDAGWPPDELDRAFPELPGTSALSMACFHKKPAIVKLLLDAGADPNLRCTSMPLVYAVTSKSKRVIDMVEMLLAAGADPDPDAYQGKTLIEWIANDVTLFHVHAVLVAAKASRKKNKRDS